MKNRWMGSLKTWKILPDTSCDEPELEDAERKSGDFTKT